MPVIKTVQKDHQTAINLALDNPHVLNSIKARDKKETIKCIGVRTSLTRDEDNQREITVYFDYANEVGIPIKGEDIIVAVVFDAGKQPYVTLQTPI